MNDRSVPFELAQKCRTQIEALEAEKRLLPRSDRREINRSIHMLRDVERWCKTRAGYVEPRD